MLRRGSLGKKTRHIGDGLIELKVDVGPVIEYTLLTMVGTPSSSARAENELEKQDIKAAKNYWQDWKAREGE